MLESAHQLLVDSITVIIPTYNRATLLSRALDSVLAQTLRPLQIIVVDDGSTDTTAHLLRSYQSAHPNFNIQYVLQEHAGVSRARNCGARAARTRWLAWLDSDDEWLPDKLATQVAALNAHPSMRLCHTEEIWMRHGRRVNPMRKHKKPGGDIYLLSLERCMMSPSSVLMQKSLWHEMGGFDEDLPACEDYALWLRISAQYPVLLCDTPLLIRYAGHADQLSRHYPAMDRFRMQALMRMLDADILDLDKLKATRSMLQHKLLILYNGACKRAQSDDAAYYADCLQRYVAVEVDQHE